MEWADWRARALRKYSWPTCITLQRFVPAQTAHMHRVLAVKSLISPRHGFTVESPQNKLRARIGGPFIGSESRSHGVSFYLAIDLSFKWKWDLYGERLFAEEASAKLFVIASMPESPIRAYPFGAYWTRPTILLRRQYFDNS